MPTETPSPNFAAPPSPTSADRLIAAMVREYAPALTAVYATKLVIQFGEGRVRAVHQYILANRDKIYDPPAFMTWELQRDTLGLGEAAESAPIVLPMDDDVTEEAPVLPDAALLVIDDVWQAAFQQLELQDPVNFQFLLRRARLVKVEDNTYTVAVHSVHARDLLQARMYRNVQRIVSNVAGCPCEIVFIVEGQVQHGA